MDPDSAPIFQEFRIPKEVPDPIPIILNRLENCKKMPSSKKVKFLLCFSSFNFCRDPKRIIPDPTGSELTPLFFLFNFYPNCMYTYSHAQKEQTCFTSYLFMQKASKVLWAIFEPLQWGLVPVLNCLKCLFRFLFFF